jgi:hypothetical protein
VAQSAMPPRWAMVHDVCDFSRAGSRLHHVLIARCICMHQERSMERSAPPVTRERTLCDPRPACDTNSSLGPPFPFGVQKHSRGYAAQIHFVDGSYAFLTLQGSFFRHDVTKDQHTKPPLGSPHYARASVKETGTMLAFACLRACVLDVGRHVRCRGLREGRADWHVASSSSFRKRTRQVSQSEHFVALATCRLARRPSSGCALPPTSTWIRL